MNFSIHRIPSLVLRALLLAAGLVFTASLVVAGLIAALGLALWSLLHGRKPVFVMRTGRPGAVRPQRAAPADVVDVQARELPPGKP